MILSKRYGTWGSWLRFSTVILCSISTALAGPVKTERLGDKWRYMIYACYEASELYTFGTNITSYYSLMCGYEPVVGSILLCMDNVFHEGTRNFNRSVNTMLTTCSRTEKQEYTLDYYYEHYRNATKYMISDLTIEEEGLNLTTTIFHQPINLTSKSLENSANYYKYMYYNFDMANTFGGIFYFYFLFVFMITGTMNYVKNLGIQRNFNNKAIKYWRKYVSIPGLFNGRHFRSAPFVLGLLPTRIESIVVFLFFCLNILLTTVHFQTEPSGTRPVQVQVYEFLADRTGIMSFALIPLLILFAGRNNFLMGWSGLPYSTFMVFHKYTARFMWIHAMIHSAGWTGYGVYYQYLASYYADAYWKWGVAATCVGGFILIFAALPFRKYYYELFLYLHIVLAILFIVGCWYHCYALGYLEWLYAAWAVWIFDRLLRVIRIVIFGFPKAQIKHVSDNTFRVTVKHNKWFKPFPGSYAFVYFINPSMFWQSHPFTIIKSVQNKDSIVICIKVKKGLTLRLQKLLEKLPNEEKEMRITVEGPYGHEAPIAKYDSALFIAGGNGIPGAFYHVFDLYERGALASKKSVRFLWSIRYPESLEWFNDELISLAKTGVDIHIYITGRTLAPESSVTEKNEPLKEEKKSTTDESECSLEKAVKNTNFDSTISNLSSLGIQFHQQRPNLEEEIKAFLSDEHNGTIAIMTCGPPNMSDDARNLVAENLLLAKERVDLFEELQRW